MRKIKPKQSKIYGLNQSVNVTQSGNNNNATIHYQTPADGEEVNALRRVLEAQQDLIRVYQKKKGSD